jgi:hypothetical protein
MRSLVFIAAAGTGRVPAKVVAAVRYHASPSMHEREHVNAREAAESFQSAAGRIQRDAIDTLTLLRMSPSLSPRSSATAVSAVGITRNPRTSPFSTEGWDSSKDSNISGCPISEE